MGLGLEGLVRWAENKTGKDPDVVAKKNKIKEESAEIISTQQAIAELEGIDQPNNGQIEELKRLRKKLADLEGKA